MSTVKIISILVLSILLISCGGKPKRPAKGVPVSTPTETVKTDSTKSTTKKVETPKPTPRTRVKSLVVEQMLFYYSNEAMREALFEQEDLLSLDYEKLKRESIVTIDDLNTKDIEKIEERTNAYLERLSKKVNFEKVDSLPKMSMKWIQ